MKKKDFKLIAHRGASKEAPENTLASIKAALSIGVDFVEVDLHLSKDQVPLVIHDARLGRTAGRGNEQWIADLDYAALGALDAGGWFNPVFADEKIPTLDEVLSLDRGRTGLMIEIKKEKTNPAQVAESVARSIQKFSPGNIVIGSFSIPILKEIERALPSIPLMGIAETTRQLDEIRDLKLKKIASWYKLINPAIVQSFQDEGIELWTFTVDDLKTADFLISIGVRGIITNDPRQIKKLKS